MLRYDTVHGQFNGTIDHNDEGIIVNGKLVKAFTKVNCFNFLLTSNSAATAAHHLIIK